MISRGAHRLGLGATEADGKGDHHSAGQDEVGHLDPALRPGGQLAPGVPAQVEPVVGEGLEDRRGHVDRAGDDAVTEQGSGDPLRGRGVASSVGVSGCGEGGGEHEDSFSRLQAPVVGAFHPLLDRADRRSTAIEKKFQMLSAGSGPVQDPARGCLDGRQGVPADPPLRALDSSGCEATSRTVHQDL